MQPDKLRKNRVQCHQMMDVTCENEAKFVPPQKSTLNPKSLSFPTAMPIFAPSTLEEMQHPFQGHSIQEHYQQIVYLGSKTGMILNYNFVLHARPQCMRQDLGRTICPNRCQNSLCLNPESDQLTGKQTARTD